MSGEASEVNDGGKSGGTRLELAVCGVDSCCDTVVEWIEMVDVGALY